MEKNPLIPEHSIQIKTTENEYRYRCFQKHFFILPVQFDIISPQSVAIFNPLARAALIKKRIASSHPWLSTTSDALLFLHPIVPCTIHEFYNIPNFNFHRLILTNYSPYEPSQENSTGCSAILRQERQCRIVFWFQVENKLIMWKYDNRLRCRDQSSAGFRMFAYDQLLVLCLPGGAALS